MKKSVSDRKGSSKKRILVLYYSQTGQLEQAVRSMLSPLEECPTVELVYENLQPKIPYPFPWPIIDFMDVFPESVYMDPPEMVPVGFDPDSHFDLVILAYQVWFLSPSLPVTGFLKSGAARVLKGRPVITFIACRNMWLTAQEKMKASLKSLGATLIDNVVLIDQGPAWSTFITTPRWLLTGKRGRFWRVFPPAGVAPGDIARAVRFGRALADSLDKLESAPGKPLLWGLGAVKVNPRFIAGEKIAHRGFSLWGRFFRMIGKQGNRLRRSLLVLYLLFLFCMITVMLPISIVVRALAQPFIRKRLQEGVLRLEEPSGSSTERMARYL
ncbi:MAG: dialkylresorcinol condensing enzyme [Proteobacteria bacterium]|nr:dialkylresorcinol condensing enzyme [Pseudomonadota bacterium]